MIRSHQYIQLTIQARLLKIMASRSPTSLSFDFSISLPAFDSCLTQKKKSEAMSSLDKLLISGIRSFNPNDKQTVTFFHPLTLIVGHNGAGTFEVRQVAVRAATGSA